MFTRHAVRLRRVCLLAMLVVMAANAQSADPKPPVKVAPRPPASANESPKELFERICSACHTLSLPTKQRLNRATWEEVVSDMVSLYGCTFMTPVQQTKIIDYLAAMYTPTTPR